MSYLKLLGARRKSGELPSMQKRELTVQQQSWADQGLCVKCGQNQAANASFLCDPCQGDDTIEDIRDEIAALRQKLLKSPK
jgi:hypothetical protein